MSSREYYEKNGKLFPAKNKPKVLMLGRFLLQAQWAGTEWSILSDKGILHTDYLSIGTIENTKNFKALQLIVWKFKLTTAWI